MKPGFYPIIRAISTIMVGIAFFILGCQPRIAVKRPPVEEVEKDLFDLAEKDFQAGNYEKALKRYEIYLEQNPKGEKPGKALYRMAKINYNKALYEQALSLFNRIVREYPRHPHLPDVKFDMANIYYRLGDYERSIIECKEWIKRHPEDPLKREVLFLMGRNFRARSDNPKAFYWWQKAVERFYDQPMRQREISDRLVGLIKMSGIDALKEMAEYAPGSDYAPHIYHKMASIYLEENHLEEAKDAAMALVRSTSKQNWVSLGQQMLERIEEELSVKRGVIGCLLPLSGPFAIYGQEVLNGIQLGMDIFNRPEASGGIELIIRDTRGKTEEAISGVEDLAEKENVIAIMGPLASNPAMAAAKKAQELGIPIITFTQKVGITSEGEMVFRNFLTPSKEIKKLIEMAVEEMALKRFAILYPDNSYGRFLMNLFWDEMEERGGSVTAVESYTPEETDFAIEIKKMVGLYYPRPPSVLARIEEMRALEAEEKIEDSHELDKEPIVDFDAVFIPDNYQQVALIAPQFPFYNIFNIRFLGTSLWQSTDLIEIAGDYVRGAIFPSGFFADSPSDDVKDFVARYKENFESEPGILAATGYDTIRFLKDLIENNKIRTRKIFQDALFKHDNFYGVTGKISFDDQGEVVKEPILLTISGKHLQILH